MHTNEVFVKLMKNGLIILLLPLAVFAGVVWVGLPADNAAAVPVSQQPVAPVPRAVVGMEAPALSESEAASYQPLAFSDLFVSPVGPRGLEFTETLKQAAGTKVRMTGHMVRYLHADPQVFLFTETPTTHNQQEYILADSLPVNLMHVVMKVRSGDAPVWKPGALTIYGTLELGSRQETDGRVSFVRLRAEHITASHNGQSMNLLRPIALQRDRIAQGSGTIFRQTTNDKTSKPNSSSAHETQTRQ